MRKAWFALLLLFPLPAVGTSNVMIVIAEVHPDPAGGREFIELANQGPAVDLAGWRLKDAAGNTFTFPDWLLPEGARVVVWGGGSADAFGPAWSSASIWNNGGDSVALLDPAGSIVDWFAYGQGAFVAPPGFADPRPPAPAKGQSLHRDPWREGPPSPGIGEGGLPVVLEVVDLAPTATLVAPAMAAPAVPFTVSVHAADPNGPEDVAGWSLTRQGGLLATGAAGTFDVTVTLPDPGETILDLVVTDRGGQTASASVRLVVMTGDVGIILPEGGLRFPPLKPGESNVRATGVMQVQNLLPEVVAPRIDVSPFRGPATLPVLGNLVIEWDGADIPYESDMQPLPPLAPGATVEMSLRLVVVPAPLPAGLYGTSLAVVV